MLNLVHRGAALTATGLIALFFTSTLVVETLAGPEQITQLKHLIVTPGLWLLIPALAVTGISGTGLAQGRGGPLITAKRRRMAMAAANGLLVLVPCALVLEHRAAQGALDTTFYLVQGVELLAGAVNLTLLGQNLRDGLRTVRGRSPSAA